MNAGIIASRYAKALLKYVQEEGAGDIVYSQTCVLLHSINELPQLKEYVENSSDISVQRKLQLLSAALGEDVHPCISRFLVMVDQRHRMELFSRMLLSFIEHYCQEYSIKVGRIITATQNDGLRRRLEDIFQKKTGARVHFQEKVSPEIIGGFVFELDGYRLDASVAGHLARISHHLVEKNERIV